MRTFFVQFFKDFKANFCNFNAYIIVAAYYILSLFLTIYIGELYLRENNIMNAYFVVQPLVLTLIIPAITMRSWADEIKTGTIEILLTQPISYLSLILSKFLASFCFFILLILTSFVLFFFVNKFAIIDYEGIISAYVGLLLVGALFCVVGNTISILNKNLILSCAITIFVLFTISQWKFSNIGNINLSTLNFEYNYTGFLNGMLYYSNITYFLVGIFIVLWLNLIALQFKVISLKNEKFSLGVFLFIISLFFVSATIAFSLNINQFFDATTDNRYTLSEKSRNILDKINKRIDITLYEAQVKRKETNSKYSVFAEYTENIIKLIDKSSNGAIKPNIVLVEQFSTLERKLINDGASIEIDEHGNKYYMVMEFADNEGNYYRINGFNRRKSHFIEADIMRIINTFGDTKKKIGVYANNYFFQNATAFKNTIEEFYDVTYFKNAPLYIPDIFDTIIIADIEEPSTQIMLALEQYILSGGSLIIFGENNYFSSKEGKIWSELFNNFGISIKNNNYLLDMIEGDELPIGLAKINNNIFDDDVTNVLVNGVGELSTIKGPNYKHENLLEFAGKPFAIYTYGKFPSNHIELALENELILPYSKKDGKFIFVNDSDIVKDYLFIETDKENSDFYETLYTSDNILFILRLLDFATNTNKEKLLTYRVFGENSDSIGNYVLKNIKALNETKKQELENTLKINLEKKDNFYNALTKNGFASVKNIGDINNISRIIDETNDELNKLNRATMDEYSSIIMLFTVMLIFVAPLIFVFIIFIVTFINSLVKRKKIRRLKANA